MIITEEAIQDKLMEIFCEDGRTAEMAMKETERALKDQRKRQQIIRMLERPL